MILELLEYLATPCSLTARSMGFLTSAIAVRARHRRCKKAWEPHLERTRGVILQAARLCHRRRKCLLLGAGLLHDIPIHELSRMFERVVLVDIVHPLSSRLSVWRFRNVDQVTHDVTEMMEPLRALRRLFENGAAPTISHPMQFVDDRELDLTVSVNLLSQLSLAPEKYLEGSLPGENIAAFARHLVEAHLDYLCRLPGHTSLITDVAVKHLTREGRLLLEDESLHGVELPTADQSWEWHLAPSPEHARDFDLVLTVAAYKDWKRVAACRNEMR